LSADARGRPVVRGAGVARARGGALAVLSARARGRLGRGKAGGAVRPPAARSLPKASGSIRGGPGIGRRRHRPPGPALRAPLRTPSRRKQECREVAGAPGAGEDCPPVPSGPLAGSRLGRWIGESERGTDDIDELWRRSMADLRHEPESEAPRDEGEVLKIVRFDDIHDSPPE